MLKKLLQEALNFHTYEQPIEYQIVNYEKQQKEKIT